MDIPCFCELYTIEAYALYFNGDKHLATLPCYNLFMIRNFLKNQQRNKKISALIKKYNIPKAHLGINRKSIANAMFLGVFFAFMPMPFQMLAILLFIPFVKFNAPLSLSLVWISNPITMPFIFYGEYLLGNFLLKEEGIAEVTLSIEWFQNNFDAIFLPLISGALITGLLSALLSRYLVLHLWRRSVKKEYQEKKR